MKEGWEETTLGEIVSFRGGGTPSTEKPSYWNGDIPWVSPKDMKSSKVGDSIDKITLEAIENSAASLIPKDAILIVVRSGILARTIPVAITARPLAVNQDIKALCPSKDIDPRYLHYFMQASEPNILALVTRGATVHRISTDSLKALKFPKPPLAEQQRIVAILDEAFAGLATATANAEKNLKNARELFDSYLNSVFAKKGSDWVDKRLGDAVSGVYTGPFGSLLHKYDYVEGGTPIVNPINIVAGSIRPDTNKTISTKIMGRLKAYTLAQGDIVVGRRGEIGRCAVVTAEQAGWLCGTGCFFIRTGDKVNASFLAHLLRSTECSKSLERLATGATMSNLSNTALQSLLISLPARSDQDRLEKGFNKIAEETQRVADTYKRKISCLNSLKQSILNKAFSGELTSPPSQAIKEAAE